MVVSKVAMIVGAGPGIGSAVAKRFAEGGYKVRSLFSDENMCTNYQFLGLCSKEECRPAVWPCY